VQHFLLNYCGDDRIHLLYQLTNVLITFQLLFTVFIAIVMFIYSFDAVVLKATKIGMPMFISIAHLQVANDVVCHSPVVNLWQT
jgi:hypothetical protein